MRRRAPGENVAVKVGRGFVFHDASAGKPHVFFPPALMEWYSAFAVPKGRSTTSGGIYVCGFGVFDERPFTRSTIPPSPERRMIRSRLL